MKRIDVIQIGSHMGNTKGDFVYKGVSRGKLNTGILVEPNKKCFALLEKCYSNYSDFTCLNLAITNTVGIITLYVNNQSDPDWCPNEHSSVHRSHLVGHKHPEHQIESYDVSCTTLNKLCENNDIDSVEYLFIDTEGHDSIILDSIDFGKIHISNIIFEHTHFDGCFQRGIKYEKSVARLVAIGYKLIESDLSNTWLNKT